jgi:rod shape-determining protein MreB
MAWGRNNRNFRGRDIAIDLGTANTLVFVRGEGIAVSEPSVVAMDQRTGEVHAVGDDAKRMIGRTPASISAVRPLRHGVITDFEVTERMLRYFIDRVHSSRLAHPRVVMCAPSGVTDAEPTASMVVDVGGGTSEVAVISLGGMVVSRSVRVGGYDLDEAITNFLRRQHNLAIGEQTAEETKITLGSAWRPVDGETMVRGRDLVSGLPKELTLTGELVRDALSEPVAAIVGAVKATLEETPPELASDIVNDGMLLAGGGCLLHGLAERLHEETGMPTRLAEDPLSTVAEGAGKALDEIELLANTGGQRRGWVAIGRR